MTYLTIKVTALAEFGQTQELSHLTAFNAPEAVPYGGRQVAPEPASAVGSAMSLYEHV